MLADRQLLTHSRQDCFKTCRRKHFYAYEQALRPTEDSRALRMGAAFHDGIAALGHGTDAACEHVRGHYRDMPEAFDPFDWWMECETVMRLVCAYQWRWANSPLRSVKVEHAFRLPLVNPATGWPTPTFDLAGKIDGIVGLEDGRLAVKETKTCSEDLHPGSDFWRRLRMDHQISLYIHAARELGYRVDTVLYDVVRKPSIQPNPVPVLDSDGIKIVLDAYGERVRNANKTWRQTSDREKGFELQTRAMACDEWGARLTEDICSRPDFYFARVEIPRLDQDIADFQSELWDVQRQIRQAQLNGLWYRTVGRNTCPFCPYFDICSTNKDPGIVPVGFERLSDIHPELRNLDVRTSPSNPAPGNPEASTAAAETAAA